MRRCAVLIAIAYGIVLGSIGANAQCPDKSFPYTFCDGQGHFIKKLSSNPHGEPGLTPLRMPGPACFVAARVYESPIYVTGYPGPQIIKVFDPQEALSDMNEAWNEWMQLCPTMASGSPSSSYCCLRIYMSQNPYDFDNPFSDVSSAMYFSADNRTCIKHCDAPIVYINFTNEFLYQDRDPNTEPMAVVYYTGRTSPRSKYSSLSCDEVYSFRQHVQHVMGIFLGLRPNSEGVTAHGRQTVMGQPLNEGDALGLTEEDMCQFTKLYCYDRASQVSAQPLALSNEEPGHPQASSASLNDGSLFSTSMHPGIRGIDAIRGAVRAQLYRPNDSLASQAR